SAEVKIGTGSEARLEPHPLRAAVLGEVHARPFTPLDTPRRIIHFAFGTPSEAGKNDRAALAALCARDKHEPLDATAKHHRVAFDGATLRWEQHTEFTTYTWELPSAASQPFYPDAASLSARMASVPQPGPLLVALDLHLLADDPERKIAVDYLCDHASLAVAENGDGTALFATDFQADAAGFVRIVVLDRGLGAERAGALVQRIIETETYRTLALLGLPEAHRVQSSVGRIETRLAELTQEICTAHQLRDN